MASNNPSYFESIPLKQVIQQKELRFHLYMFQHCEGQPYENQRVIVNPYQPHSFGTIAAQDWDIRDGPTLQDNIVARAQGLHLGAGMTKENWFSCFNIVFTDARFKNSSLKVLGTADRTDRGEWAIIGGTGDFAFAQGVASRLVIKHGMDSIIELRILAMCLTFPEPVHVTKIGPWGGGGGIELDVQESVPQRLESVTIRSGVVIDSIAFSYLDPAGRKQTIGPWGGDGDLTDTVSKPFKILLAPLEIVKEVSGTTGIFHGETVVTSLTFITNIRTYGPFGKTQSTTFSVPLKDSNVVGFFVRAGKQVNAIGVYARPSIQH